MSSMFKKPDNSAAERQIELQRQETARAKAQAEQEQVAIAEETAARRRARQRGGTRSLLSMARVAPETGIQTLGTDMTTGA